MLDLCCFGFLSAVRVLRVARYPVIDSGAEVDELFESIGADAALIALLAARFGLDTGFVTNPVGGDVPGRELLEILERERVRSTACIDFRAGTPQTVIVTDHAGSRTWFSFLPGVDTSLMEADAMSLGPAKLAYIDLYQVIRPAAIRFMRLASERETPIYVNLGGDPIDEDTAVQIRQARVSILQSSANLRELEDRERALIQLAHQTQAELVILTFGKEGCLALKSNRLLRLSALEVRALHAHGAGAAFSAGMAYGWVRAWPIEESLKLASALGGLFCTVRDGHTRLWLEEASLARHRIRLSEG